MLLRRREVRPGSRADRQQHGRPARHRVGPGVWKAEDRERHAGEAAADIEATSAQEPHEPPVAEHLDAEAVQLEFVKPPLSARRLSPGVRQAERYERRR